MVVLKVASSQVANVSGYWPPALPDAVETIGDSHLATAPTEFSALLQLFALGRNVICV